jgi:hypothetical protein
MRSHLAVVVVAIVRSAENGIGLRGDRARRHPVTLGHAEARRRRTVWSTPPFRR